MALWDHRTFAWKGEWWAAQVHGAFGVGSARPPTPTEERVHFTCLSDKDRNSCSSTIPAGWLNRLDHQSIGRLLESASQMGYRHEMGPYNAPNVDEVRGTVVQDDNGLEWVVREIDVPVIMAGGERDRRPALEFVCLNDSALHGQVKFESAETLQDFRAMRGAEGIRELIPLVLEPFKEYDPGPN